jgi:hypothetical protein
VLLAVPPPQLFFSPLTSPLLSHPPPQNQTFKLIAIAALCASTVSSTTITTTAEVVTVDWFGVNW